jgi:SnoaL-like domain
VSPAPAEVIVAVAAFSVNRGRHSCSKTRRPGCPGRGRRHRSSCGDARGRPSAISRLGRAGHRARPRTPVTQTLHRIIADGDYAVAEWTSRARARNGTPYGNDYAVVFHVTGGRIDAVTEYCDTSYMKRTLFEQ